MVFLFVVVCAVDLPFYMTTGVNVDVILNCFFTCKDRASERDRPYQRKKNVWLFLCLFFVVDLPCYMTTGVNVDFISNCFFTCKDRALERDRPYLKKEKNSGRCVCVY